jgi:Protein of unknown function (DUF2852)
MTMAPYADPLMTQGQSGASSWFGKTERWLDNRGKGAWIASMILGFVFFWPVGLAILAYMIWSKRMFGRSSCGHRGRHHHSSRADWEAMKQNWHEMGQAFRPTGNAAFDAYKADTIRRLQDEQEAFESFLQRLRQAKDKSEFDAFMDDRARGAQSASPMTPPPAPEAPPAA